MTALMNSSHRSGLIALPQISTGAGTYAFVIGRCLTRTRFHLLGSVSIRSSAQAALDELLDAALEALEPNWNGYGSSPVQRQAYAHAKKFIQALPTTVPKPEIGIDADGEISVDWLFGSGLIFSVSIGAAGRLTFASLIGERAIQGTEWLDEGIPAAVLDELTKVAAEARRTAAERGNQRDIQR